MRNFQKLPTSCVNDWLVNHILCCLPIRSSHTTGKANKQGQGLNTQSRH